MAGQPIRPPEPPHPSRHGRRAAWWPAATVGAVGRAAQAARSGGVGAFTERGVIALACSVVAGAVVARPVPLLVTGLIVVVGLSRRRPVLVSLGLALSASALAAGAVAGAAPLGPRPVDEPATLLTDPVPVPGGQRAEVRLPGGAHVEVTARGRAAAGLRRRLAGEVVQVAGIVQPRDAGADRLLYRHVVGTLDVDAVRFLDDGSLPARAANAVRRHLADGAAVLPPDQQALFTGLVFGDDRAEDPVVIDDFRAAGLTHLLAVSGENVAFVLVAAGPVLRRLGPRTRTGGAVGLLVFFAFATRLEPSVLRATAMVLIATVTTAIGSPVSARRTLALAVTALVLADPLLVRSVGFQLSVAASAGIIVLARPIAARLPGPRVLAELVGVTVGAQVGVAPVLLPVFGSLPVAALPANLLAVPAAGPVMVWGLTGGVVAGFGGPAAVIVHTPTRLLLAWIAGVARVTSRLPLGSIGPVTALALAVLGVVLVVTTRALHRPGADRRRRRAGSPVVLRGGRALTVVLLVVVGGRAALDRPVPVGPEIPLGAGAVLHVGARGSAVVLLDGRARLDRVLAGLREAGGPPVAVVVQRSRSTRLDAAVAALGERLHPRVVLRPAAHDGSNVEVDRGVGADSGAGRVAGAGVTAAAAPGDRIDLGDLLVEVTAVDPVLRVTVTAPPDGTGGSADGASRVRGHSAARPRSPPGASRGPWGRIDRPERRSAGRGASRTSSGWSSARGGVPGRGHGEGDRGGEPGPELRLAPATAVGSGTAGRGSRGCPGRERRCRFGPCPRRSFLPPRGPRPPAPACSRSARIASTSPTGRW